MGLEARRYGGHRAHRRRSAAARGARRRCAPSPGGSEGDELRRRDRGWSALRESVAPGRTPLREPSGEEATRRARVVLLQRPARRFRRAHDDRSDEAGERPHGTRRSQRTRHLRRSADARCARIPRERHGEEALGRLASAGEAFAPGPSRSPALSRRRVQESRRLRPADRCRDSCFTGSSAGPPAR